MTLWTVSAAARSWSTILQATQSNCFSRRSRKPGSTLTEGVETAAGEHFSCPGSGGAIRSATGGWCGVSAMARAYRRSGYERGASAAARLPLAGRSRARIPRCPGIVDDRHVRLGPFPQTGNGVGEGDSEGGQADSARVAARSLLVARPIRKSLSRLFTVWAYHLLRDARNPALQLPEPHLTRMVDVQDRDRHGCPFAPDSDPGVSVLRGGRRGRRGDAPAQWSPPGDQVLPKCGPLFPRVF